MRTVKVACALLKVARARDREALDAVYKIEVIYTTNELNTPTKNTSKTQSPRPENTVPLFCVQPSGEAKTTGTPITKRKERPTNASNVN